MPTIFIEGFKFRFYSSDITEPPHVHVLKGERVAKIWLRTLEVANKRGYNRSELNGIVKLTKQHRERLMRAWNEYFSQEES